MATWVHYPKKNASPATPLCHLYVHNTVAKKTFFVPNFAANK